MSKNFRTKLVEISGLPLDKQKQQLEEFLSTWQGSEEQNDVILVIGVRM